MTKLKHLLKKLPLCYSSMRDESFWTASVPTNKEAYFNDLTQEPVDDKKYQDLLQVIQAFGITTGRQLHDGYLYNDILQLADVCENFRNLWHDTTSLDPFHKQGLPGAAWDNLLKNSKCSIENITEECCGGKGAEFMRVTDANIRGGLSSAFVGHAKANNPKCPDYVPCDPETHTYIRDFDANSLYPYCMSMPLPVGEYEHKDTWGEGDPDGLKYLNSLLDFYDPDHDVGYMLVVKQEIPDGPLHDKWDYAPAVNRQVEWSELSKRQQKVKRRKYLAAYENAGHRAQKLASMMKTPSHQKLIPDLNPQDRKAIHIQHAQLLRKHGVVFTKLYDVYSFKQARIFEEVLGKHAAKRASSTDESVRDLQKLAMNSAYGKTLENKRKRGNGFKVHTDINAFQRNAAYKRTFEFRIQHYCEDDGSFLGVTSAKGCKPVVLDTPRLVGWAVLEYAKMVMMSFHYDIMKPLFGDRLILLYTDTDSMYYLIRWPSDPIDFIAASKLAKNFDLSQTAAYRDCPQKNKLGCFKYEGADNKKGLPGMDNEIVEAVFLAPKSYIKKMAKLKKGSFVSIVGKGVPNRELKKNFGDIEHYKNALFKNKVSVATYRKFQASDHIVSHCEVTKVALSSENDKVFQVSPGCSRPLGHYRNKELEVVSEEWALSEREDEAVELAQKLLSAGRVSPPAISTESVANVMLFEVSSEAYAPDDANDD